MREIYCGKKLLSMIVSFRCRVWTWATRFLRIFSGATPAHRRDTLCRIIYGR